MIMSMLSILLLTVSFSVARAAPWHTLYARQSNDNGNNGNGGLSSSVWIPIVFIGGLFLLGAVWVVQRKMASRRADSGENVVSDSTTTTTSQARELTATELAGGTRPTTARRPRRPRRTPSQVSTRSLPAYMKEPGDNEVVIYRGLEDMEEEAEGEPRNVQNSTTMNTSVTSDTARTDRDSNEDTSSLLPPRTDSPEMMRHSVRMSRGSFEHQGSDDSHARLIDVQRGEAPAYETIDLDAAEEPAPAHNSRNSQSARMSGFFSRFMPQRGNNGATNEPVMLSPPRNPQTSVISPSHSRQPSVQSGVSAVASADSHDSPRHNSSRAHRNNPSTGSVFTLFSRTLPRSHDDGPLTSPSMISLNSISPPLTHTATRTEFTYPRTGPTSEQVKFLSSKETFGRFGIPYGPDAIAFAASSSRLDLPPDFDSVHRPSFSDLSPNPDGGSPPGLGRSTSTRRVSIDNDPGRVESPSPESTGPSRDFSSLMDQRSLARRNSGPDSEVDDVPSPLRNPLPKQKSTPTLGIGHPSLLKSTLKSKSMANLQRDGNGSLPPRSTSATGSYLTVDSFQTAHDDEDGTIPSSPLGLVPQIMVQLPSNNPSATNLAGGDSDSDAEVFFDGEEGPEGNRGEDGERGTHGRGNKSLKTTPPNGGNQFHAGGQNQEGDPLSPRTQNAHSYPLSTDSDSGSDGESEAETHSNNTEVDRTWVTTDPETDQVQRMHEGADVTLIPEMVAAKLKTNSPVLVKSTVA